MAKAKRYGEGELGSALRYAQWVIYRLQYEFQTHPLLNSQPEFNLIDFYAEKMRAKQRHDPYTWERRFDRAAADTAREPLPFFALMALVACAFAVAAEREAQLPEPNRLLDFSMAAMWWCGLYGGHIDHKVGTQAVSRKKLEKAAASRHSENRQMRDEARAWYQERRTSMSKDAAAEAMARKVFPVSFRTVRSWLIESSDTKR